MNVTYTQTLFECPACGEDIAVTTTLNVTEGARREVDGATGVKIQHHCWTEDRNLPLFDDDEPAKTPASSTSATETGANAPEASGEGGGKTGAPEWRRGDVVFVTYSCGRPDTFVREKADRWIGTDMPTDDQTISMNVESGSARHVLRDGRPVTSPSADRELKALRAKVARAEKLAEGWQEFRLYTDPYWTTIVDCGRRLKMALRDGEADE